MPGRERAPPGSGTPRRRGTMARVFVFFVFGVFGVVFFEDTNIFGICLMCFCFCAFFGSLIVVFGSFVKEVATVRWGL